MKVKFRDIWETVQDRKAWCAAVNRVWAELATAHYSQCIQHDCDVANHLLVKHDSSGSDVRGSCGLGIRTICSGPGRVFQTSLILHIAHNAYQPYSRRNPTVAVWQVETVYSFGTGYNLRSTYIKQFPLFCTGCMLFTRHSRSPRNAGYCEHQHFLPIVFSISNVTNTWL